MFLLSLFIIVIIFIISPESFVELELRKAVQLLRYHVCAVLYNFLPKLELPEHKQECREKALALIVSQLEFAHRKIMGGKTEIHNTVLVVAGNFT